MSKDSVQGRRNAELRAMLLKNFQEIRPLTNEEAGDEFLIWDRTRKLFPGLEETLELPEFVLLRDEKVVAQQTVGFEHKAGDVLRALSDAEVRACMENEHKECFCLSMHAVHVIGVELMLVDPRKGHRRHHPKKPHQSAGTRDQWGRETTHLGMI